MDETTMSKNECYANDTAGDTINDDKKNNEYNDYIRNSIVKINIEKNNYAKKKVVGDVNVKKQRELVSLMIYLISEIKYNTNKMELDKDSLYSLYKTVNELNSQVLFIVNSTSEKLREIMKYNSQ